MYLNYSKWGLERKGKHLLWSGCNLSELGRQYGTPLFVFNGQRLKQTYREIESAFRAAGLNAEIFFSFKTNPVPEVLKTLIGCGAGAEVVSEFEFWLAKNLAVPASRVVVNGSVKTQALLSQAVKCGAALVNVETPDELRTILEVASSGERVNVGLRINPALKRSRFDFTIATGAKTSHIGLRAGSSEWRKTLETIRAEPALNLRGLHFHVGSGVRNSKPYMEALDGALEIWQELLDEGFSPSVLDIGGGFQIPTLKVFSLLDAVRLFVWERSRDSHSRKTREGDDLVRNVAELCAERLEQFSRRTGSQPPIIYTEPGRALAASSALLLLTVGGVVERGRGKCFALCDGGAMSLSPLLLSEHHAILVSNKDGDRHTRRYNVMGNLPTPLDVVSMGRELPELSRGDIIAVLDTGAYFTSLGNNFAGPRPAIVMIDDGVASLIRRRETHEDLVARDSMFDAILR